ncbi:MAG: FAD-binding oxidoreductase, partial [Candidatus Acidiferrum sp.]
PPASADVILSTARLNRIIEHVWADLTVTVEAGCTIQNLQAALAQHGQRLALDPLWPGQASVGGVLSANDSGALRLRFGAPRDLIIGVTLALPDGTLARSGGKVVKNVAGYDLPKLATGAFGTLGVVTRAVFRLHPLPRSTRTLSISADSLPAAQSMLLAIQDCTLAHTAMQLRCAPPDFPFLDILFESTEEGLAAQEEQLRQLVSPARVAQIPSNVWNAREQLWSHEDANAIVKLSVLPASIASTLEALHHSANSRSMAWRAVAQATGIVFVRLQGLPQILHSLLLDLRTTLQSQGASLVVLRRPANMPALDAWGQLPDSLPLMRAVKQQLDPNGTLNPGRFLGGI